MSQENVEVIKALFEGWQRGDRDVTRTFDPEVEFARYGGEVAVTRRARGIEEMTVALVEWIGEWSELRFEAERVVDLGDRVLVLARHRGVGRRSGLPLDHLEADVFTLRDGKIVRWEAHWDPAEAQRALDLEEEAVSQQNAAVAERAMDAFNRRDIDAFIQATTADFEWFPALGMAVEGGSFRGREGVETYFETLDATWEEVRVVADEVRGLGESVIWLGRIEGRGRGSGVPVDAPMGAVFDFRGGKVWRARSYLDHAAAAKAVGLEE